MLDLRSDPDFVAAAIKEEAEHLGGSRQSFAQRAAVQHHLYAHSAGNHAFPLLAAHGSLWSVDYLRRVRRAAELLKWEHLSPARRKKRVEALCRLAETIGEIDRQAFVASYVIYRLTEQRKTESLARTRLPASLAGQLERCHGARRAGERLDLAERRALFAAFLEWQQGTIIGPAIGAALEDFNWEPLGKLALQPWIRLPYFPRRDALRFMDIGSETERVEFGLRAFDLAERVGWEKVEASLKSSKLMPVPFQRNSGQHFFGIQNRARRMLREEFLAVS